MKKWLTVFILLLVIGILVFVFLLFRQRSNTPAVARTTHIEGKLVPPSNISPKSFEIVALNEVESPNEKGKFSSRVYENGVTVVGAMIKDKEYGLISVIITENSKPKEELIIDSKTTASGLIFTTPFFATNNPERTEEILRIINNDPKVLTLTSFIENHFSEEFDFLDSPEYQQLAKESVESVLETLNP